jgi:hypothetical protein
VLVLAAASMFALVGALLVLWLHELASRADRDRSLIAENRALLKQNRRLLQRTQENGYLVCETIQRKLLLLTSDRGSFTPRQIAILRADPCVRKTASGGIHQIPSLLASFVAPDPATIGKVRRATRAEIGRIYPLLRSPTIRRRITCHHVYRRQFSCRWRYAVDAKAVVRGISVVWLRATFTLVVLVQPSCTSLTSEPVGGSFCFRILFP